MESQAIHIHLPVRRNTHKQVQQQGYRPSPSPNNEGHQFCLMITVFPLYAIVGAIKYILIAIIMVNVSKNVLLRWYIQKNVDFLARNVINILTSYLKPAAKKLLMLPAEFTYLFFLTVFLTLHSNPLNLWQFDGRFRCVMAAAANVAWSRDEERAAEVGWSHFYRTPHPQIVFTVRLVVFRPQLMLPQVISLDQTLCISLWRHYIFTYAAVLQKVIKHVQKKVSLWTPSRQLVCFSLRCFRKSLLARINQILWDSSKIV